MNRLIICASTLLSALPLIVNPAPSALEGIWKSKGYGLVIQFSRDGVDFYDTSEISCSFREHQSLDQFLKENNRIDQSEPDSLSFFSEGGITRYGFQRLSGLPARCLDTKSDAEKSNPAANFGVFWQIFKENYAFFDKHGIDWNTVRKRYRPTITDNTSAEELYRTLVEIIGLLNDPHVSLYGEGLPKIPPKLPKTLVNLLENDALRTAGPNRKEFVTRTKATIADHYLGDSRKEAIKARFTWGWVTEDIGYFSIDSMSGYSEKENKSLREYLRAVDATMDRVIRDLKTAKGLIVDARWNTGGYDATALHIAGHFTDKQLLAFTKKAKHGPGFAPIQQVYIPSHALEVFSGPIVFLSSRDTVSAAEIFSMAMMAIPNVTSMGESTAGFLSDANAFHLPNGWKIRLSNEVYTAVDGGKYEVDGIPVDVSMPPRDGELLESYIQRVLDQAINHLNGLVQADISE